MNVDTSYRTSKITPGVNSKKYIIGHHTGTPLGSIRGILNAIMSTSTLASWHYSIDQYGGIYKHGNHEEILWHAGKSTRDGLNYNIGLNPHSIGIEVISNGYSFTDAQRDSFHRLVKAIMLQEGIEAKNVLTHQMIAPQRKRDVGPNFYEPRRGSWKGFQDSLGEINKEPFPWTEKEKSAILAVNSWVRNSLNGKESFKPLQKKLNEINEFIRNY